MTPRISKKRIQLYSVSNCWTIRVQHIKWDSPLMSYNRLRNFAKAFPKSSSVTKLQFNCLNLFSFWKFYNQTIFIHFREYEIKSRLFLVGFWTKRFETTDWLRVCARVWLSKIKYFNTLTPSMLKCITLTFTEHSD